MQEQEPPGEPSDHHVDALHVAERERVHLARELPEHPCARWASSWISPRSSASLKYATTRSKIALQTGSSSTAFSAFDAGWSPDGTKLVFSLLVQGPAGSQLEGIGTANADGSDIQMITTSPGTCRPVCDDKAGWGPHPLAT